jgi:hypothetical protein
MASRFALKRHRDVVPFLRAAIRLRKLAARAPGNVGLGLRANPLTKTFWTLSTWESGDALRAYAATETHRAIVSRFKQASATSDFVFWDDPDPTTRPTWREATTRLAERGPGARVRAGKNGVT